MPYPHAGQSKDDYISEFMGSSEARKSFPDAKQRAAVAYSEWEKKGNPDKHSKAAVGIVRDPQGGRGVTSYLVGKAQNTGDWREGKWVHAGGGIKEGETPEQAAVREVREETGIECRAIGKPFEQDDAPGVLFVHCEAIEHGQTPKPNHEFSEMKWLPRQSLTGIRDIGRNTLRLIDKAVVMAFEGGVREKR